MLGLGDTKASILLTSQMQADLRLVPAESRGAALQYFTGSKAHNIALRQRALSRGYTLNEYALADAATGARIAGETEDGIYAALGLPCIDPTLREARGEIDAAEAGTLPRLVTLEDLRGDVHMHTTASDGRHDIETMAIAARDAGRSYICITDHSQSLAMANGLDDARALAHAARIREVERAGRRHHDPRRHRGGHPRRRPPRPGGVDAGGARLRRRLGPLGLRPDRGGDDGAGAHRDGLPVRRRHRPPDRAQDPAPRAAQDRHRGADRGGRALRHRPRDQQQLPPPRPVRRARAAGQGSRASAC